VLARLPVLPMFHIIGLPGRQRADDSFDAYVVRRRVRTLFVLTAYMLCRTPKTASRYIRTLWIG